MSLRGGAVSSGRSISIDLKRDRRVGVANSITEDFGSMPESSDSVEYVCRTSCSRTRRTPAASTRWLNLSVTVSGCGRCPAVRSARRIASRPSVSGIEGLLFGVEHGEVPLQGRDCEGVQGHGAHSGCRLTVG